MGAFVASADVEGAFDGIKRDDVEKALLQKGVHPESVSSLLRESSDLKGTINLPGVGFILARDYRKAQKRRRGSSGDAVRVLHHLCWADDLYAMAGTMNHLTRILEDMTNAIERLGMRWKEKSLTIVAGPFTEYKPGDAVEIVSNSGTRWTWRVVEGMEALGTWLDNRVGAYTQSMFQALRIWALGKLRRVLCLRRRPNECWADYMKRTGVIVVRQRKKHNQPRVQILAMRRVRIAAWQMNGELLERCQGSQILGRICDMALRRIVERRIHQTVQGRLS